MSSRPLITALVLSAALTSALHAQVQTEVRGEFGAAREQSTLVMLGANLPADYLTRIGLTAGGGTWWKGREAGAAARVDLTVRLVLDPFGESLRGWYVGAGGTGSWTSERRAGLTLLVGLEGKIHHGWRPSLELGVGEGIRAAIVLRKARRNSR